MARHAPVRRNYSQDMSMTPQEEEMLVRIIVQCVRAVLEAAEQESAFTRPGSQPGTVSSGSRFIDVVPQRNGSLQATRNSGPNSHGREEVREALQRFLRQSEPALPALSAKGEPHQEQTRKRQLVTREDVLAAQRQGLRVIRLQPDAVVTPLARQVAKEKGIELQ